MKKQNIGICKYDRCQSGYDRDEVARVYGELSNVFLLGYCYTRDTVKEVVVFLNEKEADEKHE